MPITPQIEEEAKLIVHDIEASNLAAEDKGRFISMIRASKACCNGMTQEEKIAGLSENAFNVNCTLARLTMMIKESRVATWKDVIAKALDSWKVVAIVAILAILLGFHPEIRDVLNGLIK